MNFCSICTRGLQRTCMFTKFCQVNGRSDSKKSTYLKSITSIWMVVLWHFILIWTVLSYVLALYFETRVFFFLRTMLLSNLINSNLVKLPFGCQVTLRDFVHRLTYFIAIWYGIINTTTGKYFLKAFIRMDRFKIFYWNYCSFGNDKKVQKCRKNNSYVVKYEGNFLAVLSKWVYNCMHYTNTEQLWQKLK